MKMEEVTNLLWIGFLMSEHGPSGFRRLWSHLHRAAKHYLYDYTYDRQKSKTAAENIKKYAVELETFIIAEKVRMLSFQHAIASFQSFPSNVTGSL
jgi:hypothetical protein